MSDTEKKTKPAGRKALPEHEKRNKPVNIYLNQIEMDYLTRQADKANQSPAKYLRSLIDEYKLLEPNHTIKLWIENKTDKEEVYSFEDILQGFNNSHYAAEYIEGATTARGLPLQHYLIQYLTSKDGLNATFEQDKYEELYEYVKEHIRNQK